MPHAFVLLRTAFEAFTVHRELSPREADVIRGFVGANIDREILVPDLAAELDMGTRVFAHAFKVAFGVPPYQYVRRERFAVAVAGPNDHECPNGGR